MPEFMNNSTEAISNAQFGVLGFRLANNGVINFETNAQFEPYSSEQTLIQLGRDAIAAQCFVNFICGPRRDDQSVVLDTLQIRSEFESEPFDSLSTVILKASVDFAIEEAFKNAGLTAEVARVIQKWQQRRGEASTLSTKETKNMLVDVWHVTGIKGTVKKQKYPEERSSKLQYLVDSSVDVNLATLSGLGLARCSEFAQLSAYVLRKIGVLSGVITNYEPGTSPHMYAFAVTDKQDFLKVEATAHTNIFQGKKAEEEKASSVAFYGAYDSFGFKNTVIDFKNNSVCYSEEISEEIARQYALFLTGSVTTEAFKIEASRILQRISSDTATMGHRVTGILLDVGAYDKAVMLRHIGYLLKKGETTEAHKYTMRLREQGELPNEVNAAHMLLYVCQNDLEGATEFLHTLPDASLAEMWQKERDAVRVYLQLGRGSGEAQFSSILQRLLSAYPKDAGLQKIWIEHLKYQTDFEAIADYITSIKDTIEDAAHAKDIKTLLVAVATIVGDTELARQTLIEIDATFEGMADTLVEYVAITIATRYVSTMLENNKDSSYGKDDGLSFLATVARLYARQFELMKQHKK